MPAIQIPVLSITEENGVFTFHGPNGLAQVISAEEIEADAQALDADYGLGIRLARRLWWAGRAAAEDKAAHDALHSRTLVWDPTQDPAVTYVS